VARSDHFFNHGARLGVVSEDEYESLADQFLGSPRRDTTHQFTRSWNGDIVRYDEVDDVFGVLSSDRFNRTFYRPDPAIHGESTNLDYYLCEEEQA
jgi:filamentous hemagglutinin